MQEERRNSPLNAETMLVSTLGFLATALVSLALTTAAAAVNVGDEDIERESASSKAVVHKTMRHEECQVVVMEWLQQDFHPKVDSHRAALRVEWSSLDGALASAGCHPRGDLRTELWRVLDKSGNEAGHDGVGSPASDLDFGTQQYFAKFRRCQHLSPDHFSHHETRSHELGRPHDEFHHVVEKNYIIRLCPCPSRNDSARCECEDLALCSAVIDAGGSSDSVFPWCQQERPRQRDYGSGGDDIDGEWGEGHAAAVIGQNSENKLRIGAEFPAPKVDCESASLSGTLVSCTPIIPDYDRVKVVFHRVHDQETESCSNHTAVHNADVADVFYSGLTRRNLTHGDFLLDVYNLTADANYCVTVELDGHPYCHPPLIVGDVGQELYRQPIACQRQNVETVLRTTRECSSSASYVMGLQGSLSDGWTIALIVFAVCVVICIALAATAFSSRALRKRKKSASAGDVASDPFLASPTAKNEVTVESSVNASKEPTVDVFLVHLSGTPSSEEKNACLREWLGSLETVKEVFDLSDPERQEEILSSQEEWVSALMERPNLRVVAVTKTHFRRNDRGPRVAASSSSSSPVAAAAAPDEDEEGRRLLHDGATSDRGRGASRDERDVEVDALEGLRSFALRHVSAHLRGQYGRLMLVRHEDGKGPETEADSCAVEDLTPLRRPLVLPRQADELARWIVPPSEPTQNYECYKSNYESRITKACNGNAIVINA